MIDFKSNIYLENSKVVLRPLNDKDFEGLQKIAFDPVIWKYMPLIQMEDENDLLAYINKAIEEREKCVRYSFVIIEKLTGKLAGSTSLGNISEIDKRIEIGWTWLAREFRGSGLNKHCKFLLLQHIFESLNYERAELKTDALNLQSRKAIIKIGATEEGILRSHTLMSNGRRRDTVYYSILKEEWPGIKKSIFTELSEN
jgi:RimJ/RimL family protein N-acetyltransferase